MKQFFALLLFALPFIAYAQADDVAAANTVGTLRYVMDVPVCSEKNVTPDPTGKFKYNNGCGDHLYWKVAELRVRAVPHLIALIENEEPTQAKLPGGKGFYKTGDVAIMVLQEIIHELPIEEFLGHKMSEYPDTGKYFQKTLKTSESRTALKKAVQKWHDSNYFKLRFEKSGEYANCTCAGKHPVGGYLKMIDRLDTKKVEATKKAE